MDAPSVVKEHADFIEGTIPPLGLENRLENRGSVQGSHPFVKDTCSLVTSVGSSKKVTATAQLKCAWGGYRVSSDTIGIVLDLLLWLKDLGVYNPLLCEAVGIISEPVERDSRSTHAVVRSQPLFTSTQDVGLSLAIRRALSDLLHTTATTCQREYKGSENTRGDVSNLQLHAEKFADTHELLFACEKRVRELQVARDNNAAKLEVCQQDIDAKSVLLLELQQVSKEELERHKDASLLLTEANERELHLRIELAEKIERLHQTQALHGDVLEQLAKARRDGNLVQSSKYDTGVFPDIDNSSGIPEHSLSNATFISAAHAGAEAKEYFGTARGAVEEITPESMDRVSAANEGTTSAKDFSVHDQSLEANLSFEWLKSIMHMTVNRIAIAAEKRFPSRARESRGVVSLGTFISAKIDGTQKLLLKTLNLLGISLTGQQDEIRITVQAALCVAAMVCVVILSCALRRAPDFIFRRRKGAAEHRQGHFAQNVDKKDNISVGPASTTSLESNDVHSTDVRTGQRRSMPHCQPPPVSETSRVASDTTRYPTSSNMVELVPELKHRATENIMKDSALIQQTPTQEYTNGGLGRLPQMRRGPPPRVFPSLKGSETGDTI